MPFSSFRARRVFGSAHPTEAAANELRIRHLFTPASQPTCARESPPPQPVGRCVVCAKSEPCEPSSFDGDSSGSVAS